MAARPGANSAPLMHVKEMLDDNPGDALYRTLQAVENAKDELAGLQLALEAVKKTPAAQVAVTREFVVTALEHLANIRDIASSDLRALAIWATGSPNDLGLTENRVAEIIGASNTTITRWNKAGFVDAEPGEEDTR